MVIAKLSVQKANFLLSCFAFSLPSDVSPSNFRHLFALADGTREKKEKYPTRHTPREKEKEESGKPNGMSKYSGMF